MILNVTALWKQEARRPRRGAPLPAAEPSFQEAWARFSTNAQAKRRLVALGVGTMAFGMADILLEPYGGQVLGLTVGSTTKLTAALAAGTLVGFAWASRILSRGFDPLRMAGLGAVVGVPGFLAVIGAAPFDSPPLFVTGTVLIGFGAGLFGHGTLTATMQLAPRDQVGLALGAWGAIQATAAGLSIALSGVLRDLAYAVLGGLALPRGLSGAAAGYSAVYALEVLLLLATIAIMAPWVRRGAGLASGTGGGDVAVAAGPALHGDALERR